MSFPAVAADELEALRLAADDPRRRILRIQNPVTEREGVLWTTLVPGLLALARQNLARQIERVRAFQVANVFHAAPDGKLPQETLWLGAVVTRGEQPGLWERRPPPPLFFEARGIAERVLDELDVEVRIGPGSEPYLHPGASAEIRAGDRRVGTVGELHPAVAAAFEISAPCALVELDLVALCASPRRERTYRDVSRHPRARRDLALVFERGVAAADALEWIRRSAGKELISAELFDRYEGKGIPAGRVSLAFRLVFQRADRTLLDAEVQKLVDRVVEALRTRLGGELR
jgi:phenylalanyl-tRNA synthetase beta chain